MQKALPYTTWPPATSKNTSSGSTTSLQSQLGGDANSIIPNGDVTKNDSTEKSVTKLVSEVAVIVFARPGCCMCHALKHLLLLLGVNPTIYDVGEQDEAAIVDELLKINGGVEAMNNRRLQFPAVFVGGKLFGGLETIMAAHISGDLIPILREARALWL